MASTKLGQLISTFVAMLGFASAPPAFARWTPSAAAPAGVLTPRGRDRHDRFIAQARTGELDGYAAKLVVLQLGPGDNRISDPFAPSSRAQFAAGYAPLVAEIRAGLPHRLGHRFFPADGSFDRELWALGGIRPPAFDVWAEELQPWLDRFVHRRPREGRSSVLKSAP